MVVRGKTDTGIVREQNQDVFLSYSSQETRQAVCVVCDGMGGARAGDVASAAAATVFKEGLVGVLKPSVTLPEIIEAVKKTVSLANSRVYEMSKENTDYAGMGTTLVGCVINAGMAVIANVGDSRAYLVSGRTIRRLTRDHSLVEEMVDSGKISDEEARFHPGKNLITRVIGTDSSVGADIYQLPINAGDVILLCSDGLSNMIGEQEMLQHVIHIPDLSLCCDKMIELANERGGQDNITVLLIAG